ncbi:uncharacterized protein LOC109712925 isoform X4 [Ananas comosus]|uniref:Uncharacterized protein LOC109712925 isoform X4 n=1 Tax=Ananas comosus TaxID=4615 RepID=A0A6P5FGF3_ANACO|nr:uncharacterized protein LOC109712925 isoform X4 [Ananas comosus]
MDPEQTFLRVHARLSGMLSQLLTPRIRLALEYIYLGVAVALFCLLVVMHTNFVQQPGCSSEFSGIEFTEAQLVQIKITGYGLWDRRSADQNLVGLWNQESSTENPEIQEVNGDEFTIFTTKFWSNWIGSARRSKLVFRSWKADKEFLKPQSENTADMNIVKTILGGIDNHALSTRDSFNSLISQFFSKWKRRSVSMYNIAKELAENTGQLMNSSTWHEFLDISNFLQMLRMEHLHSLIVQWLERRSQAFEPMYLYTIEKGYFLLSEGAKSRHGIQTINITLSARNSCFGNRWQQLLINGIVGYDTILINSLLSSPGQGYLYNFQTKELYDFSYGHEPAAGPTRFGDYFVTKCGVLIMSLFVFFTTTMSVSFTLRETQSRMLKFTVQLQHHARHQLPTFQLIFVHVIESLVFVPVPALQRFIRSRAHPQQQPGVQIESSTIYASTFHIARVNATETGEENSDLGTAEDLHTVSNHSMTNLSGQAENRGRSHEEDEEGSPLPFPDPANPQQAENAAPGGGHSLLLWLLGGGSSEGIVSLFSMFRDVRDQGQDFADSPTRNNENEQAM